MEQIEFAAEIRFGHKVADRHECRPAKASLKVA
nr:MAG TPA: hypothetical protein [Caudoviricetes sp.]